jgi:hypothetical protein
MARQPDVQYVHYYTYGSAARKLELQPEKKNKVGLPQPKMRRDKRMVIPVDPIYLCAMFVAAVMLVTMAIGMIQLGITNAETAKMENYVEQLYAENTQLRKEYEASYDLEAVKQQAQNMGLVPVDQVEHISIDVQIPQPEAEPGFWESFAAFWAELFA